MRWLWLVLLIAAGSVAPATAEDCAAGLRPFSDARGVACIPEQPQRIVALNDQIVALPLYELGAPVVGSAGRVQADGTVYLRGGMDTLGIDFANTDITYVGGFDALDIEAIASLQPDLIIGGSYTDAAQIEQLQLIAPTIVIDNGALGLVGTLQALADASGRSGDFEARYQRYLGNIERTKSYIGDPSKLSATLTFMFPNGEDLWVYRAGLGAISQLLSDLGVSQPPAVAALPDTQASWSPELIQQLDADFIFGFYRQQPDATPQAVRDAYEHFAPGWCEALSACRNGQFILLPGPTFGSTMTGLELALDLVETHIAARAYTPREGE